jgi:ribonuclease P protein component
MTIPRRSRLTGKTAFSDVFEQATVSSDACFKVLGRRAGQTHARLGMAVSRQVDRRAVQRNRLKRIIRESFRAHYLVDDSLLAADFVVLPRSAAVTTSKGQLLEQLDRHWRRLDQKLPGKNATGQRSA